MPRELVERKLKDEHRTVSMYCSLEDPEIGLPYMQEEALAW